MTQELPGMMRAVALDQFGGVEQLRLRTLPVPEVGPEEVLIRVESAGVSEWDPAEREGWFARELGIEPRFPYILGSDVAGTVVACGERVEGLRPGDRVYGVSFLNAKGGAYAEYVVVPAEQVAPIPPGLSVEEAGAMMISAITALQGLDDTLELQTGESLLIFGASGGVGHIALQLAKRMGARVLAVASGRDGVELVQQLGADTAVDGRSEDVLAAARQFAPHGIDAAMLTAGGETAERALQAVRDGGRVAYPNGVEPVPKGRPGLMMRSYNGTPNPEVIARLNRLIQKPGPAPFHVHVARTFSLEQAAEAHRALEQHHIGKLTLKPAA